MKEGEIVKGCLKGDMNAQRALYEMHAPAMMSVCRRYAGNQHEAQDILQEGFITIFDKLNQYSGKGSLAGWIRTVMVNTSLIYLRRNKKHQFHHDIDDVHDLNNQDFDALSQLSAAELMELINNLPGGYKTVFNLFAIEGFSHKEIAKHLGISESTSKSQFFKARTFLKKQLEKLEKAIG